MTPYQQSIEAAKSWKEAVGAMWKRQRIMLYMGIACLILLVIGLTMLFAGIEQIKDLSNPASPLLISSILVLLLMLAPAMVSVVMMWIFYFDVRRWHNAAPESLKKSIKLLSLGLLITLIAAAASGVVSGFTTIPYIGGAAELFNSLIEAAAFAGVIIEFIAIIRLRRADDMPEMAKRGANSIFINYIITFITTAVSIIIIMFAGISLIFNTVENYDTEISNAWTESEDVTDESNDNVFLSGMWNNTDVEVEGEDMALLDSLKEAKEAIGALIVAFIILIGGSIVAMYYYYRGWWLISQSELPTLPEPIEDEVGEDVAYEEVEVECVDSNKDY